MRSAQGQKKKSSPRRKRERKKCHAEKMLKREHCLSRNRRVPLDYPASLESFVKPKRPSSAVSTVPGLFLRQLNSHPSPPLRKRELRIILASHRRDDTRPCFSRTASDDSTTWWSLKPRERRGMRGQARPRGER